MGALSNTRLNNYGLYQKAAYLSSLFDTAPTASWGGIHAAIWSLLGDGSPSLIHVAGALRMPPRTLQRRLAADGTSLHREIEEVRKAMAMAALRDRSMVIQDVAFLLGYSEPSTFFRSFKRWTGTTPRHFRDVGL